MEREVSGNSPDMKFKHTVEDINELLQKQLITIQKRNQLVAEAHKTIIEEPAAKKNLEAQSKRTAEADKFRAEASPAAKFNQEAEKIRKLEVAGELTQQQAAKATLDARKDAIAAMLKLQKESVFKPELSFEVPKMQPLSIPTTIKPEIPKFDFNWGTPPPAPELAGGRPATTTLTTEMELRNEAMKARGEEITKKLEHPFETFKRTVNELQSLRNIGAINATTQMAGVMEARQQAMDELKKRQEVTAPKTPQGPAALEAGSQAAFSAFQKANSGLKEAQEQVALLKRIDGGIAALGRGGVIRTAKW